MEVIKMAKQKFDLGDLKVTAKVTGNVSLDEVFDLIKRHARGDWGDVSRRDWKWNDQYLRKGMTLSSRYLAKDGTRLWIVTRHDRSATNVLLASEAEI